MRAYHKLIKEGWQKGAGVLLGVGRGIIGEGGEAD